MLQHANRSLAELEDCSMNAIDYTLLAIDSATSPLKPVQLQKSLFLLGAKLPQGILPDESKYIFKPYDYGPFCADIYSDAERLEREGFVEISRPPKSRYKEYAITRAGHQRAQMLKTAGQEGVIAYLQALVEYTQRLEFNQLVSSVYHEFPDMKVNSIFKDDR